MHYIFILCNLCKCRINTIRSFSAWKDFPLVSCLNILHFTQWKNSDTFLTCWGFRRTHFAYVSYLHTINCLLPRGILRKTRSGVVATSFKAITRYLWSGMSGRLHTEVILVSRNRFCNFILRTGRSHVRMPLQAWIFMSVCRKII